VTAVGRTQALRAAHAHLLARRFAAARDLAQPWSAEADGALLYGLALAGSGAVAAAAALLARIAAANPRAQHPLQDLLGLVPPEEAIPHLRAGLELRPDDPRLLALLGQLLSERGPAAEAVDCFRRAAHVQPGDASAWSNLGKACAAEARFDEADEAFDRALRLTPGDAWIGYNRALMLLKAGRSAEGWTALRVRHALPGRPPPLPGMRLQTLDVAGRRVLLRHEEGFGDTLQFIRYARPLAERGAHVIAAVPPALARLVATAAGVAEVVAGPVLPPYDVWSPLLDVPALFGGAAGMAIPYLRAKPGRALPPGRKAGLVWAGDPEAPADRIRSVPDASLLPLRDVPGWTWVNLQLGRAPAFPMHDPMPAVRDFADTAAIVAQLDLVVSADTAVAHLAGALGKPVLLLDRYDHCWRWGARTETTAWYPSMRILRQPAPGDWDGAVAAVVRRLTAGCAP